MPNVKVYNMKGQEVSTKELSNLFEAEYNEPLVHQAVVTRLANMRQGTKGTLTRTEVRGGGRKPWRQKGTGHARQGSTRSPQWTHGGVALGPKPRLYKTKLNKKVRRTAMISALSSKVASGDMIVLDKIETSEFKTKIMVKMLSAVGAKKKSLVVLDENDLKVRESLSNIPGVKVALYNTINVYDILNCDSFIVAKGAAEKIQEVYA